ncbi:hypothetical protein HKT18_13590 [Flavobacterium sp. IMCC34852]|uniref:Uncharacterized protein n=1 Tax=Flavobacterium rivulicola TaxID=2732161 RepID=A0A7Y3RC75_9FLAO|nr:hypothetical protein [Flavobacterium sp. IMCC34852]NNT73252.1 hypothetical protein [Flavobacterium sp. IMCC34852]
MNEKSQDKEPAADDWRRQGQEKYLKGIKLELRDYFLYGEGWEHDHCEFCNDKFSLNDVDLKKGYMSEDGYRWICIECFNDFKDEFSWQVKI